MFKMPNAVSITGRSSTITNSFVNSIIPLFHPTEDEIEEALSVLGMSLSDVNCAYCGDTASEWDHLRPLVKDRRPTGYVSEIANLVPACGKCNQSKGGSYWRDWMLGPAVRSPRTRAVPDLETRVQRLEAYECWREPRHVDFESLVGEELWAQHWHNHARLMELMIECQKTAEEIRLVVKAASSSAPEAHAEVPPAPRRKILGRPVIQHSKGVIAIDKQEAIARVGLHGALIVANTHFSNINVSKAVWWLDLPLSKITAAGQGAIDLLLYDGRSDELHHLKVPTEYLRENLGELSVRADKGCIHLELKTDNPNRFQNVVPVDSGVQFAQFCVR